MMCLLAANLLQSYIPLFSHRMRFILLSYVLLLFYGLFYVFILRQHKRLRLMGYLNFFVFANTLIRFGV